MGTADPPVPAAPRPAGAGPGDPGQPGVHGQRPRRRARGGRQRPGPPAAGLQPDPAQPPRPRPGRGERAWRPGRGRRQRPGHRLRALPAPGPQRTGCPGAAAEHSLRRQPARRPAGRAGGPAMAQRPAVRAVPARQAAAPGHLQGLRRQARLPRPGHRARHRLRRLHQRVPRPPDPAGPAGPDQRRHRRHLPAAGSQCPGPVRNHLLAEPEDRRRAAQRRRAGHAGQRQGRADQHLALPRRRLGHPGQRRGARQRRIGADRLQQPDQHRPGAPGPGHPRAGRGRPGAAGRRLRDDRHQHPAWRPGADRLQGRLPGALRIEVGTALTDLAGHAPAPGLRAAAGAPHRHPSAGHPGPARSGRRRGPALLPRHRWRDRCDQGQRLRRRRRPAGRGWAKPACSRSRYWNSATPSCASRCRTCRWPASAPASR